MMMRSVLLVLAVGFLASACQPSAEAPQRNVSNGEVRSLSPELLKQLEEVKNRRKYVSFDLATLREIKDEHLEPAILDYIFARIAREPENKKEAVLALPRGFRSVYLSWLVEAEVLNGGFNQYFWNSSGQFAELTPAALIDIGSPEAAQIMRQAIATASAESPTMARFRAEGTVEAFVESYKHTKLNDLDDPFSELAEQFRTLRLRYIRANENAFLAGRDAG